jgi:hypothetical protein
MQLVNRAVTSLVSAGDDGIITVRRDGKWSLYRELALPIPPVPLGTGERWGAIKPAPGNGEPEENVELAILVTSAGVWLSLSRVNELQQLDGFDLAKIEEAIKQHKASAFFADRDDIEIAAEDDVHYDKLVQVIDIAMKNGFTHWTLATPSTLVARPQL